MPTALATTYCSADDVESLLSGEGVDLALEDNGDGLVSAAERARLTTNAIQYATARVNFYCQIHYEVTDLATSWTVNEWATIIAARWLCRRRGCPVPASLEAMFAGDGKKDPGVMGEMDAVRKGEMNLPDIGKRNTALPLWSNVRVDQNYRLRKIRVERPISEQTPAQYTQNIDRNAELIREPY